MSMLNDRDAERAASASVPVTRRETMIRDAEMRRARAAGGKVKTGRSVDAVTVIPFDADYIRRFGSVTLDQLIERELRVVDDPAELAKRFERFADLAYRPVHTLSGDERRELRALESILARAGAFAART